MLKIKFIGVLAMVQFFSSAIQAQTLPVFEGVYSYARDVAIVQQKHTVQLIVINKASRQLLDSYIQQNYTCRVIQANNYTCSKFIKNFEFPENLKIEIDREFEFSQIIFEKTQNSPALINDGLAIKEWILSQTSHFQGVRYAETYYIHADGLIKMNLVTQDNQKAYFILDAGKISAQLSKRIDHKKSSQYETANSMTYAVWLSWVQR